MTNKHRYTTLSKTQPRKKHTLIGVVSRTQKEATLVGFETSRLRILWVVPFCYQIMRPPKTKGGETFMDNKPIFECWCVYFSKIIIYQDRVEVKKTFGLTTQTIPISKIASVNDTFMGIVFETSGGGKPDKLQPWDAKKKKEIVDTIFNLINKK